MHRIIPSIRRIQTTDLPTVTPVGEPTRPATDQELLNLGIAHIGGDLYSCIHQEQTNEAGEWFKISEPHPGVEVSSGSVKDRYAALHPDDKALVLHAAVVRDIPLPLQAAREAVAMAARTPIAATLDAGVVEEGSPAPTQEVLRVPLKDVLPGDVVQATNLIPHSWSGERHA